MTVIHTTKVQRHDGHGGSMWGLAVPSLGATEVALWRATMNAGQASQPQSHDHEEVVFVLAGLGQATIGEEVYSFGPGDVLIIPAHQLHQVTNMGDIPLDAIIAMPLHTRTFWPDGSEAAPEPWAA